MKGNKEGLNSPYPPDKEGKPRSIYDRWRDSDKHVALVHKRHRPDKPHKK